ncbi:MAG: AAA family ATPase [Nocardioides sp.]
MSGTRAPIVVVTGLPGAGKSTVADLVAEATGLPVLSLDTVKEAIVDEFDPDLRLDRFAVRRAARTVVVRLAAAWPRGGIIDIWLNPVRDESGFVDGVRAIPGATFLELVCRAPLEVVLARYAARERHGAHLPMDRGSEERIREAAPHVGPFGLGPHRDVDTTRPLDDAVLTDLVSWLRDHGAAR